MLDAQKLYLDSCATYYSSFARWVLGNVHQVSTLLQGNCNLGVSTSYEKGFFGIWDFWFNDQGIANLLFIPQLDKNGYVIDYNNNPITVGVIVNDVSIFLKLRNEKQICNTLLI